MQNITIRDNSYRVRLQKDGKRISKTFPTHEAAQQWVEANTTPSPIPLAELIESFIDKGMHNRYTRTTIRTNTPILRMWQQELGNIKCRNLKPVHILRVRDKCTSAATGNRIVSVLSAALRYGIERNMLDENVALRIRPLRVSNANTGVYLSQATRDAILYEAEHRHEGLHTYLRILIETGARMGEVASLSHKDCNLKKLTLTFRKTKNGEDRVVPISRQLGDFIRSRKIPRSFPRNVWSDIIATLNIVCRPHDLRHSYITDLLEQGIDPITAGKLVGHKSIGMTARYYHPEVERLRKTLGGLKKH